MPNYCEYKKEREDGYGATWKTACGHKMYCESPIDVGFCFAPLPTDGGVKFCCYCGNKIVLVNNRKN